MSQPPTSAAPANSFSAYIDKVGRNQPDIVLMAPYMTYLVLLALVSFFPPELEWIPIVIRGVGSLLVAFLFLPYMPSWGKPYMWIAVPAGLFAAWGWVAGDYFFEAIGLGGRLPGFPGEPSVHDLRHTIGAYHLFRATVILKILVACTAVPVVEELFWRAFLLRALIKWDRFDTIPLGKFTWFSFIGTALISTVQHPDNWMISIFCWLFFNLLFYWTRSIWCLVIVHSVTNFALYFYVVKTNDWSFW
ncbi:MAG: CAAX prenyl protease-related protein [Phycisphaerae bacterium]